jgi:hypothetical protein
MTVRVRKEGGWRYYPVAGGEVGVGNLRRPKFFPSECRLNSTWMTRAEAAQCLRGLRAAPAQNIAHTVSEDISP